MRVGRRVCLAAGFVRIVDGEEYCDGLHDYDAGCKPVLVSIATTENRNRNGTTYHIGGTQYLLIGLNFGENTAAIHSREPGILSNQSTSVKVCWKALTPK